jgi:hypothetical protein
MQFIGCVDHIHCYTVNCTGNWTFLRVSSHEAEMTAPTSSFRLRHHWSILSTPFPHSVKFGSDWYLLVCNKILSNIIYQHVATDNESPPPTEWPVTTHSQTWALLDKPPILQLLKNFPAFCGIRRFVTVLLRAIHWSLSQARSIQSIPSHHISLR